MMRTTHMRVPTNFKELSQRLARKQKMPTTRFLESEGERIFRNADALSDLFFRRQKMNKKGTLQDFLFYGIIVLILSIVMVVGGRLTSDFNTEIQDSSLGTDAKTLSSDISSRFPSVFDNIFIFVFVLFAIAIMASMFMLDSHPVLFFAAIIIFGFILLVMAIMANVFDSFKDNTAMVASATSMPIMSFTMSHFVIGVLVFGFLGMVVLYAKTR